MNVWVAGCTGVLLAGACWTDVRRLRIPNGWTAGFAAGGLVFHAVSEGWEGMLASAAGAVAGMVPLLLLYRLKGIGGGDVKWFGAFGMWAGTEAALRVLMGSVLIAGAISAALLLLRLPCFRGWGARLPWPWGPHPALAGKKAVFPFMLAVMPAYAGWITGGSLLA